MVMAPARHEQPQPYAEERNPQKAVAGAWMTRRGKKELKYFWNNSKIGMYQDQEIEELLSARGFRCPN